MKQYFVRVLVDMVVDANSQREAQDEAIKELTFLDGFESCAVKYSEEVEE